MRTESPVNEFVTLHIRLTLSSHDPLGVGVPFTVRLDKQWIALPSYKNGTVITTVHADPTENGPITYGLETTGPPVPFTVNPRTGEVTVNDTLADKENQTYLLWVTFDGGTIPQRAEVLAMVTDKTGKLPKLIPKPPSFNYPFPLPMDYPFFPKAKAPPTKKPLSTTTESSETSVYYQGTAPESSTSVILSSTNVPEDVLENKISISDLQTENEKNTSRTNVGVPTTAGASDVTITLVSLLAVTGVVFIVVMATVYLWKKHKPGKSEGKKDSMSKDGSGIVLQDTAALHHWERPRANSNRYESWDNGHLQEFRAGLSGKWSVRQKLACSGQGYVTFGLELVLDTLEKISRYVSLSDETSVSKERPRDEWEFPRHKLRIFNIVGEGAFGQVWRGHATDIDGKKGEVTVAVKTLKENASEKEKKDLLQELIVMKNLGTHPNVVRLIGCCTEKEPALVIMEFVSLGKLQQFLRDSRAERHYGNTHGGSRYLTSRDLTHFAYQVARGMAFLSSKGTSTAAGCGTTEGALGDRSHRLRLRQVKPARKGDNEAAVPGAPTPGGAPKRRRLRRTDVRHACPQIIHRDLAARNVLITEERTCKVADFGFARDVGGAHVYERKSDGRLPIRWMAPESLYDDIFSVKSDVWSFGVLLWEIVTLGSTPYPGLSAGDVMRKVRDGHRLEKPEHCRRELYNIMYYCWEAEPSARPDFSECGTLLEHLLCTETDYIELERFPDHSYYNVQHLDGEKL
ncbi:Tyrosine kinase receptor Cad96Ca [Eumeta japonica]|uniref:receptor protein-tyrosine kinase n=1 Tax=Eumeta variegata TaxID=151549 RepID=A0A4C1Y552_EUMVA|nr:Tyrosine kinase receptor Cad96Ca [Eumeta japonica]